MPTIRSTAGVDLPVSDATIASLRADLRGQVLLPGADGYDPARQVWNAMIDRRPGLIIRCAGAADVVRGLRFVKEHRLLLAVRGGGHNIAGNAVCDGGVVFDLSPMKAVRIDPVRRIAHVEAGCTLGDLDHDAQVFGLATPLGINSTTGIAGLTLGGGFGWLTRKHGLTVDNLLSADVVTADGQLVTADGMHHADLFWALRGGGGNFGIATSFEFQLHPVGPTVLSGLIVHPFAEAERVLRFYREFAAGTSDEVVPWIVMRKAPPLPFLPPQVHGKEVLVIAVFYAGDIGQGERALAPLRQFGSPIADAVGPHPYVGWQQAFDPLLTPGMRNYWKSHNFLALDDGLIRTLVDYAGRLPSPHCEVFLGQLGGASRRVPVNAMAYAQREVEFVMNVHGRWEDAADDQKCIAWSRALVADTARFATGGVYVNFMTADEGDRVHAAYGANYERLAALKAKYDPANVFRLNHNIQPVVA